MVQVAKGGYTRTAMALVNDQAARRVDLVRQREGAAQRLAEFEVAQAGVAGEREPAVADPGPVHYFATCSAPATKRVFILAVVLLLDPATFMLLLAA